MNTSRKNQAGSHHVVLVGLAVFGLIGLLGFVGYNSWQKQSSDAGSRSTIGRTGQVQSATNQIKSIERQLAAAKAEERKLSNSFDQTEAKKEILVAGISKSDDARYKTYLKNFYALKKKYDKAINKPGASKKTPAVKSIKSKLDRLGKVYYKAKESKAVRDAYVRRLNTEKNSEPVKSLLAAKTAARKENAPLLAASKKAEANVKKAEAAYKKKATSANYVRMYSAIYKAETAQTNLDVTQAKLDAARESLLAVTTTWPEGKKLVKSRGSVQKSRANFQAAAKALKNKKQSIKALEKRLTESRKNLQNLKNKSAGKKVNKKEAVAEKRAIDASKRKASLATKKASTAKKKNAEVKRKVDQSSKKAIQKKQSNNNQKKRNRN